MPPATTSITTPFQDRVFALLEQVPRGRVTTYGALARALKTSPRAVGNALRNNPYAPRVPCHRCIASSGYIHGFAGQLVARQTYRQDGGGALAGTVLASARPRRQQRPRRAAQGLVAELRAAAAPQAATEEPVKVRKKVELLKDEGVYFDGRGMLVDRASVLFEGPWTLTGQP
ncbi:hypothetical protein KEM52_001403 [Ascosphaera acerosa]|nr:hypothetical protein KEM52_001403 [Ascosphaera acerosa]